MLIAAGGFGLCGIPELLIDAVVKSGVKGLTIASNNCGVDGFGLGKLLDTKQIAKMMSSYVGENDEFMRQLPLGRAGDRVSTRKARWPSGMRAGGAGIPGFYTKTGVGTQVAEGKGAQGVRRRDLHSGDGARHLRRSRHRQGMEGRRDGATPSSARPRATSTLPAAMCGKLCVMEVEEIVPTGSLDPDGIHLPGIYVHRLIQGEHEKRIEQRTVRKREERPGCPRKSRVGTVIRWPPAPGRNWKTGCYVNLGIGIPTLVSNYIPEGKTVILQSGERHAGHGPLPL